MRHRLTRTILTLTLATGAFLSGHALPDRFHCDKDTLTVNRILALPELRPLDTGERIRSIAKHFAGTPATNRERLRRDTVGTPEINVDEFDNLGFLNTVIALGIASGEENADWHTFAREFENISCRNGEAGDFASTLFFPSLWISDNKIRKNIIETTEDTGVNPRVREKTINDVSHHREDYGVLKDSATYEAVRLIEMGYCLHRFPYLDNNAFTKKAVQESMRNGDIIMLLSTEVGADSHDMGIISIENGQICLIHCSPKEGKVVLESVPLDKYIKVNTRRIAGGKILRVTR